MLQTATLESNRKDVLNPEIELFIQSSETNWRQLGITNIVLFTQECSSEDPNHLALQQQI